MAKKKVNVWMIVTFIIGILFLSCVVYISVSKYKQSQNAKRAAIFESGAWQGYQFAVNQFIQSSKGCNPISVTFQNETMQFIDVACLESK